MVKQCYECRAGEHENYDDDVCMTTVRDPDGEEKTRRGYLCGEHRTANEDDGYEVWWMNAPVID